MTTIENNKPNRSTRLSNGLIALALTVVAVLAYVLIAARVKHGF